MERLYLVNVAKATGLCNTWVRAAGEWSARGETAEKLLVCFMITYQYEKYIDQPCGWACRGWRADPPA
jgi:hypothetical protein